MAQNTGHSDLIDILLDLATPDAALQLYAYEQGGQWPKAVRFFPFGDDPHEYAAKNAGKNVYFNCCLMAEPKSGRGNASDARVMPFLFADLDAAEGKHHGDRATKKQLAEMLKSGDVVPVPSIVVDSGGGLHAYWLLDTPLKIHSPADQSKAEEMLLGLNNKIRDWHVQKGYKYERLKDLARVLRVPGTFNHKTDKPIEVKTVLPKAGTSPKRYPIDELTILPINDKNDIAPEFDPIPQDQAESQRFAVAACMKIAPEWGNDASGYVVKCCRQCVRYGCTVETAIKVIRAMDAIHRLPKRWTDAEIAKRFQDAGEQSESGEALKDQYEQSDWGFARRVCVKLDGKMIFVREWGKWASWTGKHFEVGNRLRLREATVEVSKELLLQAPIADGTKETDQEIKAWTAWCMKYQNRPGMEAVRGNAEDLMDNSFTELDQKTDLFHCDNVTLYLDPKTGAHTRLNHDSTNKNSMVSRVVYNPDAQCPTWDRFLTEILVDDEGQTSPDLIDYIQRVAGFCLTGRVDHQSIFILYGGGQNGKGAFCRTLLKLLGDFGISIKQEMLADNKTKGHDTQFASLYAKRCVIAQEMDQGCKLNEAQVKWLTGGDPIRCRRMREDEWEFMPTHKMLLATNNLPIIRGTDHGIWRRVKLIPFKAEIAKADKEMEPIMQTEELSGILNWCLEGYRKACQSGLDEPTAVRTAKDEYKEDMDIVAQFVSDKCVLDSTLKTENSVIYQAFKLYCDSIGQHVPSIRKLSLDLQRMGVSTHNSNGKRLKIGIGLRSELPNTPEFDEIF